jgi:tripartite-type tricarboxylate transporter receptor subunit TctC
MMTMLPRAAFALLTLIAAFTLNEAASAADYPTRPVKMVVPYPPGGPNDVIARILAQKLSETLGGQFYVENQAGAGGTIGAGAVANAPADGHTMVVHNQDIVVQPIIKAKVPYDPFKSFAPVTLVVGAPEMIVVNPTLPVQNMKELLALLKANPGKYSYASPGYGTTPHLACEWLFKLTFHNVLPAVAPHLRQGTMRALAVASSKRSPFFPDVPTLEEAGTPGHEVGFWMGVLLPAGTPKPIVDLLQSQIAKILALPDVKERLATIGFDPLGSTPEGFSAHMKSESDKWAKVVREVNIKID